METLKIAQELREILKIKNLSDYKVVALYRRTKNYFTNSSCIKIRITPNSNINPYHYEILVENNIPNLEIHYDDDEPANRESAYFKAFLTDITDNEKYIIFPFNYGGKRGADKRLRCFPSNKTISDFSNEKDIANYFAERFFKTYSDLNSKIIDYIENPQQYFLNKQD